MGGGTGSGLAYTQCDNLALPDDTVSIAAIPGGLLVLVPLPDAGMALWRFTGQGCTLTRDLSFEVPTAGSAVAADDRGFGYVLGSFQSVEVSPDGGTANIPVFGNALAVSRDGTEAYSASFGTGSRQVRSTTQSSFMSTGTYAPGFSTIAAMADLPGGRALAGGSRTFGALHQFFVVETDGGIGNTTFGATVNGPDAFCWIGSLSRCGNHYCATDRNCRKVSTWDPSGAFIASLPLASDSNYSLTQSPSGEVYMLRVLWSGARTARIGLLTGF